MRIGFLGGGQMARALATGINRNHPNWEIWVSDPNSESVNRFRTSVGSLKVVSSNHELLSNCDVIFLAVKPQMLEQALEGITLRGSNHIVVSVVAGVSSGRLVKMLESSRVIRVMPNTPALIGYGALAIGRSTQIESDEFERIKGLLEGSGLVVEVEESQLDAVTGLSGSGPAYVFEFIEGLIDGGVKMGLPREVARGLAVQTVIGAAQMLNGTSAHPGELRDQVTSPGGTTSFALHSLQENRFRASVISAVQSATERAHELGR